MPLGRLSVKSRLHRAVINADFSIALAVFLLALLLRLAHSFLVAFPSNDGVHYLGMAQDFSNGQFADGMRCIFHPGTSLLHAPFIHLAQADPYCVARIVNSLAGALVAVLVWRIAKQFAGPLSALLVAILFAVSFPANRLVADNYSESCYLFFIAFAVLQALRHQYLRAGLGIGIAYWLRPEALTLLPLLFICKRETGRRYCAISIAVGVALCYPLLRWLLIDDFALTPKFAFMKPMGPLGAQDLPSFFASFIDNVLALPMKAMSGLDFVGLPFGIAGLVLLFKKDRRMASCLLLCLLLGFSVMLGFQVKARFFLGQMPVFLLLSALALEELPAVWPKGQGLRHIYALGIVVALTLVGIDFMNPPKRDKWPERGVGVWLATSLDDPDAKAWLVTDMPRVAYYAGRHPPPPAFYGPQMLRPKLLRETVEFVVLGVRREGRLALMDEFVDRFERISLPQEIRQMEGAQRIGVFRRRK